MWQFNRLANGWSPFIGKFISYILANDTKGTLPIGKNSYAGTLGTFNILIADNGQAIATINSYEEVESMDL